MDNNWIIRGLGLFFVLLAIAIRSGHFKRIYWRSKGGIYGYLPMGLLFLWYSYFDLITALFKQMVFIYYAVFGILILLTLLLALRTPQWAKPEWIKWVEKYPAHIRKKMAEVAKDDPEWEAHAKDEDSFKKWVRTLTGKKS